ncbi:MAG: DNA starvation/stationary phase protection protein [Propionibacteriaceae bacterium]|jgi:starvation-inducible DNA-binding protein|nr:DNA starvation/stationary phase protection protein [Propionibacteriaceae bacterium]
MPVPQTVPTLQAALVDLIDLGLQAKQAHWNVQGKNFRSVHLQLDEVVTDLIAWQDEVAERISAVGGSPDGRAATVAQTSKVESLPTGYLQVEAVVADFAGRLEAAARRLEATLTSLDEDLPSQDILIGIVAGLDKAAWFFRAQLA